MRSFALSSAKAFLVSRPPGLSRVAPSRQPARPVSFLNLFKKRDQQASHQRFACWKHRTQPCRRPSPPVGAGQLGGHAGAWQQGPAFWQHRRCYCGRSIGATRVHRIPGYCCRLVWQVQCQACSGNTVLKSFLAGSALVSQTASMGSHGSKSEGWQPGTADTPRKVRVALKHCRLGWGQTSEGCSEGIKDRYALDSLFCLVVCV
jgi:hypothetical protein